MIGKPGTVPLARIERNPKQMAGFMQNPGAEQSTSTEILNPTDKKPGNLELFPSPSSLYIPSSQLPPPFPLVKAHALCGVLGGGLR
jgi:hypothetical protein